MVQTLAPVSLPQPKEDSQRRVQAYLRALEVGGMLYCRSELAGPWGIEFPQIHSCAMFHLVTEGRMWLQTQEGQGRWVEPGDFVLLPHGVGHVIQSDPLAPTKPLFSHDRTVLNERCELLRAEGDGARTLLMCGVAQIDHPCARRLVDALPSVIHIPTEESEPLRPLIRMIAQEAQSDALGSFSVLSKLADVLIIHAIRYWLENGQADGKNWLGALADDRIGKALEVIHSNPEKPWSVQELATEVAMSRAAFSQRFTEMVGETVMAYLTKWRMELATKRLGSESVTIGSLAFDLGYESETAFSQAFKRIVGVSPGSYRKKARGTPGKLTLADVWPEPV